MSKLLGERDLTDTNPVDAFGEQDLTRTKFVEQHVDVGVVFCMGVIFVWACIQIPLTQIKNTRPHKLTWACIFKYRPHKIKNTRPPKFVWACIFDWCGRVFLDYTPIQKITPTQIDITPIQILHGRHFISLVQLTMSEIPSFVCGERDLVHTNPPPLILRV